MKGRLFASYTVIPRRRARSHRSNHALMAQWMWFRVVASLRDAVAPLSGNARYLDFVHSGTGGKPRHKRLLGFRGVFGPLTQTDDMRKSQLASRHNQKTASRPAVADLASPTVADEATPGIALSEASATTTRGAVASGRSPHAHVNDLPAQSANAVALRSRSTPTNGQSPDYGA